MSTRRPQARGFTLLEVLVALAIVALSAGALLGTVTSSASNISFLKDKTLGEWVALNRLTEIRIAQQFPAEGKRTGSAELGGLRWQWEEEVSKLPIEGMLRIDVRVRPTGETVDDSRQIEAPTEQKEAKSEASGNSTDKLSWMATVTGVVASARSPRQTAIGVPLFDPNMQLTAGPGGPNNPNNPNNPGAPGSPSAPGMPGTPGNPGGPGTKPPPVNR